jgi:uncharacterized membrane protein YesL
MGLFGGYIITVLLAGYVLLFESNEWLRKAVVKAVAVMILFSFMSAVINLIPNVIGFINDFASMFGGSFYITFLSNLINAIDDVLFIIEKLLLLVLGVKALNQGSIPVPVIDNLINKYMG